MNIFNYLYKLSDKQVHEFSQQSINDPEHLPNNVVTDGYGNLFRIPETGKTPKVTMFKEDDYEISAYYDWEARAVMITDGNNTFDYGLGPSNFIDNPDYWFEVAYNTGINEFYTD